MLLCEIVKKQRPLTFRGSLRAVYITLRLLRRHTVTFRLTVRVEIDRDVNSEHSTEFRTTQIIFQSSFSATGSVTQQMFLLVAPSFFIAIAVIIGYLLLVFATMKEETQVIDQLNSYAIAISLLYLFSDVRANNYDL